MNDLFQEFKKITGLKTSDIERETGYSRQGLLYSFDRMEKEGKCSRLFETTMQNLLARMAQQEADRYQERMKLLYEARNLVSRQKS